MRWSESYLVAQAEGRPLPKRLHGELPGLDSDRNGALSKGEIARSPGEGLRLHLLMFDTDHDGALDRRELLRAISQWRSVMQVPLF